MSSAHDCFSFSDSMHRLYIGDGEIEGACFRSDFYMNQTEQLYTEMTPSTRLKKRKKTNLKKKKGRKKQNEAQSARSESTHKGLTSTALCVDRALDDQSDQYRLPIPPLAYFCCLHKGSLRH